MHLSPSRLISLFLKFLREITLQNYLITHIKRFEIGNSLFRIAVPEIHRQQKPGVFQVIILSINFINH